MHIDNVLNILFYSAFGVLVIYGIILSIPKGTPRYPKD